MTTTARRRQVSTFLFLAILALGACDGVLPKPSYTRTMLKVSRSLPGETEELRVRTSEGNLATLIVKRRDKSSLSSSSSLDQSKFAPKPTREENITASMKNISLNESRIIEDRNDVRKKSEIRKLEDEQVERIRATFSRTSSKPKDEKTIADGQIDGKVTFPGKDRSISGSSTIDYGNWTPLSVNGRALKQDERSRDEEVEEYRNWRPLQATTTLRTIIEERTNYDGHGDVEFGSVEILRKAPFVKNLQDQRAQSAGRNLEKLEMDGEKNERALHYAYVPRHSRPRTNIGANLLKNRDGKAVPAEVIVRSEINVKTAPKRSPMSLDSDGTPVIHGTRVPDDPIDKMQVWRNARVINNKLIVPESTSAIHVEPSVGPFSDSGEKKEKFEKFFKDVNRRYGRTYDEEGRNVYFEWDPRNYKSETLKADVYEPRNDHYRANVHKRMLHSDGIASYPISQRYIPDSQTIAPVALKPGARAPVLQYAHPELGVQPAKILKNEKRRPDNFPENQHSFTEQRHKKKYVLNDKSIIDSYTTKNYYPNQHFYGLKRPNEPPFWVKISENLKNQFSTSVEKVSQFTRPVIDPLVEATHKISQNLGLSNDKEAQDKIGTMASGSSILIPALGLVASGAALGIGAVAVGRYLDVDVLKRSSGDDLDLEHKRALQAGPYLNTMEDTRGNTNEPLYVSRDVPVTDGAANEGARMMGNDEGVFLVLEEDKRNAERIENRENKQIVDERDYVETGGRRRRSLDYLDIFSMTDTKKLARGKRFQRKGADAISEIVEIDVPANSGRVDITEFLIPNKNKNKKSGSDKNTVLIIEDGPKVLPGGSETAIPDQETLENVAKIVGDIIDDSLSRVLTQRNNDRSQKEQQSYSESLALGDRSQILKREMESVESVGNYQRKDNGRVKRNADSDQELLDALQNLENAEVAEVAHIQGDWASTPCAKRIFCDAMIQRGSDASMLMEKKMAALLALIQPGAAVQVSSHFEEVMNAVRRHDCSGFLCPQARPGNVFL